MKIGSSTNRYSLYQTLAINRAKRKAVNSRLEAMSALGGMVFSSKVTLAQGLNEIAAQQYAARIKAAAQAKLSAATKTS